jgi:hypothetical protein
MEKLQGLFMKNHRHLIETKINIRIWYDVGDYWKLVCEAQVHLEILMFEGEEDGDLTIA